MEIHEQRAWCEGNDSPVLDPLPAELGELLRQHHERLEERLERWMGEEERLLQGVLAQHFRRVGEGVKEAEHEAESPRRRDSGGGPSFTPITPRSSSWEDLMSDCPDLDGSPKPRRPSQFMLQNEDHNRKQAARAFASERSLSTVAPKNEDGRTGALRRCLRRLVASNRFELVFGLAIISNAIFIGIEVEVTTTSSEDKAPEVFRIISHLYALIFLLELCIRLGALGGSFFCKENWAWNILDLFIVVCSLWEGAVDLVFETQGPDMGRNSNITNVRIIRIVRITRLIRITRISRLMRFVKALRTLVYSIICTLKSLVWAMLLIGLLIYVFGIFFAQVSAQYLSDLQLPPQQASSGSLCLGSVAEYVDKYWGTLGRSMTTLFKVISGGINWQDCVDPLGDVHWIVAAVFYMFIAFAHFAVMNVVTGVFCQSAIESAQRDQDMVMQAIMANKQHHVKKLQDLFKNIDSADSGSITIEDLECNMQDAKVQAYFNSLELDIDDAWTFFKLLDTSKGHSIKIEDFLLGCMRLRGSAKALDIAKLMHEQEVFAKHITSFMLYVEGQFQTLGRAGLCCPSYVEHLAREAALSHRGDHDGHRDATQQSVVHRSL